MALKWHVTIEQMNVVEYDRLNAWVGKWWVVNSNWVSGEWVSSWGTGLGCNQFGVCDTSRVEKAHKFLLKEDGNGSTPMLAMVRKGARNTSQSNSLEERSETMEGSMTSLGWRTERKETGRYKTDTHGGKTSKAGRNWYCFSLSCPVFLSFPSLLSRSCG